MNSKWGISCEAPSPKHIFFLVWSSICVNIVNYSPLSLSPPPCVHVLLSGHAICPPQSSLYCPPSNRSVCVIGSPPSPPIGFIFKTPHLSLDLTCAVKGVRTFDVCEWCVSLFPRLLSSYMRVFCSLPPSLLVYTCNSLLLNDPHTHTHPVNHFFPCDRLCRPSFILKVISTTSL